MVDVKKQAGRLQQKPSNNKPEPAAAATTVAALSHPEPAESWRETLARGWSELKPVDRILRAAPVYLLTAGLVLTILWITQGLSGVDLSKPLPRFGEDGFLCAFGVKSIGEGSLLFNSRVGAPLGLHFEDFFQPDLLHLFITWILVKATGDPIRTINLYFLGGFVLAAWCALFAMRKYGVSTIAGVTCAVLYSLLPSHFLRAYHHLFLTAYYTAPLVLLTALKLMSGPKESPAVDVSAKRGFWRRSWPWKALLVAAVAGGSGVYYAAYSMLFFGLAALYASLRPGIRRQALLALGCIAITAAVTVAGMLPVLRYKAEFGPNLSVAKRSVSQVDSLSLKIAYLLLPSPMHRLEAFRQENNDYAASLPTLQDNESRFASLGIAGGVGFCALLIWLFTGRTRGPYDGLMHQLSVLNIGAVVITMTASFGSLFALFVTPQLRAHNRISVFIAFLALFALALLLDRIQGRLARNRRFPRASSFALISAVLVLGVFDQTPSGLWAAHANEAAAFDRDAEFIGRIEKLLPAGSSVLQLPYESFPEGVPPYHLAQYGHLRGYIHSKALRWSYPQMQGRFGDQWVADLSSLPPFAMARQAVLAGYGGIYIDRNGFADHASELERQLAEVSGTSLIASSDGNLTFLDLRPYEAALKAKMDPKEWESAQSAAQLLMVAWAEGSYSEEHEGGRRWHWCEQTCDIYITNIGSQDRRATVQMKLFTASSSAVQSRFGEQVRTAASNHTGVNFAMPLVVHPGPNRLRLSTDALRAPASGDPRKLYIRVEDFRIDSGSKPEDSKPPA